MKRLLSPHLNPAGLMSAAAAVYAVVVMVLNATHHRGVIDPAVIVAAVGAAVAALTRQVVTPVSDPRDGNGKPLVSATDTVVRAVTSTTGTTAVLPPPGGATP